MAQIVYEKSFISDIALVRTEVETILLFICEKLPFIEECELLDFKLVFSELLYNAVIHGNKRDLRKYIDIFVEIADGNINGKIKDYGKGFNHEIFSSLSVGEDDLTKENGRGIRIVHSLCDKVTFSEDGTEVYFSKRVASYS